MITLNKITCIGALVLTLFTGGFSCKQSSTAPTTYNKTSISEVAQDSSKYNNALITINGEPLSVSYGTDSKSTCNRLAIVLKEGKSAITTPEKSPNPNYTNSNKKILGFASECYSGDDLYVKADALIQAEIIDNDHEKIELKGMYENNELKVHQVKIEGKTLILTDN